MSRLKELGVDDVFVQKFLSQESVEIGRRAVEDAAVELRDARISVDCGNGIVCREFDRTPSSIIRMRTDTALMVALRAMLGIES